MTSLHLLLVFLLLTASAGFLGWRRARAPAFLQGGRPRSRAVYHGSYTALWCAMPMIIVALGWLLVEPWLIRPAVLQALGAGTGQQAGGNAFQYLEIRNIAAGVLPGVNASEAIRFAVAHYKLLSETAGMLFPVLFLVAGGLGFYRGYRRITADFPAREQVEKFVRFFLLASSTVAILATLSIVLALLVEALRFFKHVPLLDFLLGLKWSPQVAIRADQVGSSGAFGAIPLFAGTLLIALIAMLVAVPIGLFSAIYLAEYARPVGACSCQAHAGNTGRYSDRGVRFLRRYHRGAVDRQCLCGNWPVSFFGKRPCGRSGDGCDDHSFHLLAV